MSVTTSNKKNVKKFWLIVLLKLELYFSVLTSVQYCNPFGRTCKFILWVGGIDAILLFVVVVVFTLRVCVCVCYIIAASLTLDQVNGFSL